MAVAMRGRPDALMRRSSSAVCAYEAGWAGRDTRQEHHLVAPPADHGAALPPLRELALAIKYTPGPGKVQGARQFALQNTHETLHMTSLPPLHCD